MLRLVTATVLSTPILLSSVAHAQRAGTPVLVSTEWLAAHQRDPNVVVIHAAAQRPDYDAGHVPGARWLAWQAYTTQRSGLSTELPETPQLDSALESIGVSDGMHIVIAGGPIQTSARLFFTLDYFGLGQNLSMLDGGIDAWREEGRPLEYTSASSRRGSITLRPQADKLVDAQWVAEASKASGPRIAVLDARTPEFFTGFAAGSNNPRAGRLPMASSVPFTWVTGELTRFRDRAKLERLFSQAGVRRGDKVVTYCHIGMQASVVYLAARLLGHDAALYDGSFEDWSKRSDLPVANGPPVRDPR
jgi:thiosulfate/3-mercaptopyruvate sulfurtransferase